MAGTLDFYDINELYGSPVVRNVYCWALASVNTLASVNILTHDDVIKWKYFPRYWPFVREILLSPVESPHKCQRRVASMFSLMCVFWAKVWATNRDAGDLICHCAHYDVTVMRRIEVVTDLDSIKGIWSAEYVKIPEYPNLHKSILQWLCTETNPVSKVHGSCRPQVGPMLAPWTLLSGNLRYRNAVGSMDKQNIVVLYLVSFTYCVTRSLFPLLLFPGF